MSALKKPKGYTVDEYLAREARAEVRHEYVAGQVYAMAGGTRRHNRIVMNLGSRLLAAAQGGPCEVYQSDMKVRVPGVGGERTLFYYPDVVVACEPEAETDELYLSDPCLIVEVLSRSTETTDRREKWLAYGTMPSLRWYILAHSERPEVTYFARNRTGEWETATLEGAEGLEIDCPGLRLTLGLDAIYDGVRWAADGASE